MQSSQQMNKTLTVFYYIRRFLPSHMFLQIFTGNENSILDQPNSIGHCISADAQMSKGFARFLSERVPQLRRTCRRANLLKDQVFPFWDSSSRRYIYNLVTKEKYADKPVLQTLATFQNMQAHATMHGISTIAIPQIGCGLDQMNWQEVFKLLRDIFAYSDIQIVVYSIDEHAIHALSAQGDPEFYADDEIDRDSEEIHLNERELETKFTSDAMSCQPDCDRKFPILRPKEQNEDLIEQYLQYQSKELIDYFNQFDFQYSDITDNETALLIDMLIDSKHVYSLHKFDVGKTRQIFHVTLKPIVDLKRQRAGKLPLQLKDKLEKLVTQLKDADIIGETGDDDEMGPFFVNSIILMPKTTMVN